VAADLRLSYPGTDARSRVRIAPGALATLGELTAAATGASHVALVADRRVGALWGARARRSLRAAGIAVTAIDVPPGERSKRPVQLERLWRAFAAAGLARADAVVALGGGVAGDLAGFAAATWLRGVPWVCVPTSLLAQVDASIGGKVAIDLPQGKNLAGAFHQPAAVLVDPELLATLPARHVRAGLAEVVKMGFAVDRPLFEWCEDHAEALAAGEDAALAGATERAVRVKARVVRADEREREGGGRTALNFGHTLGHAIEAALGYRKLLHGEAVAIGMRAAAELSVAAAGLPAGQRVRLEAVLDLVGLPLTMPPVRIERLLEAMAADKKRANGRVRWVLTPQMGDASVPRAVPNPLVRAALLHAGARG
jgi:3-dehydroquinate synthase